MRDLPRQLARGLHAIGSAFEAGTSPGQIPVPDERVGGGSFVTSNADVDHDGRDELLVQYPIGAHGTALQVFGWRGDEFNQIGQLSVGTPAGFKVEDYDGDGRLEIVTHETDWSLGLPYALAPHESIWYRWDGQDFKEISRAKDYASDEVEDLLRDHSGG